MREFLITSGFTIVHRIPFDSSEFGLYSRAVAGDVEAHNALNPGDIWSWGESGTLSDPTLTDDQRAALAGQAEIDRIAALSSENQAIELEARLDSLASDADARQRKAIIRGQAFDAQAWFLAESEKITVLYTKI